ncbi:bifunctional riboflavin kinase/FAD synthetase [Streptococcus dysgalactiae]|uniref:Riboflavin biosynthesis protein n=1 Tax=Streptococcus dysgalactiae subsp. dysgalactiae TaxID=99822 RepID=A0A9X7X8I7_STRDY|nr:bifunctional riboflavin kinase/FAD synthetase [Streptococcus dysgalactiae]MSU87261.1 bifunctional riboflavin kinase/FAD synthetase [Streptococcus dysgalactiae subsp. dysgalactiae]QGG98854.1 bifunctional riboflavin kinase/FAD synthetase [Streptococcus dysgalactiae subsp. dysgalactiae]QGH02100.1 bifunctional riboflavin kinase/FAD synthetase [Streptococcus dysgalactiae subsp. dysgalactiae]
MDIEYIKGYQDIHQEEDTVLVLGYFDGLHRGHKALFDKAQEIARAENLAVVTLTFNESPRLAFSRFSPDLLLHITYPEKRHEKFAEYGVDRLYLIDFTSAFSMVSSDDFIAHYIKRLKAKHIVVGFDYKFGHNRTDSDYLARNFDGNVYTIPEVTEDQEKISSTRIRKLILKGEVAKANQLLGYELSTRGMVVHGDARGRTIGFPTANLAPIDRTYLPADGVYVTDVLVNGKKHRSMTSIGKNVTFGGKELRLEANIFGFEGDIYGESIEIIWLDKIRDMAKFDGIEDLVERLELDKETALNWKKDSQLI